MARPRGIRARPAPTALAVGLCALVLRPERVRENQIAMGCVRAACRALWVLAHVAVWMTNDRRLVPAMFVQWGWSAGRAVRHFAFPSHRGFAAILNSRRLWPSVATGARRTLDFAIVQALLHPALHIARPLY